MMSLWDITSLGDFLFYALMALAWTVPLVLLLKRVGLTFWWAVVAFVSPVFLVLTLWFVAFPKGWTPPEEEA